MAENKDVIKLKRQLIKQLRVLVKSQKIRRDSLAVATETGESYLSEVLTGKKTPSLDKFLLLIVSCNGRINISIDPDHF